MKKVLRGSICILLIALLAACAARRSGEKGEVSQIRHDQALRALEAGRFRIEIDESYRAQTRRNPVKTVTRNYIAVSDGKARLQIVPDHSFLFRSDVDELNKTNRSRITKLKSRKNGSTDFRLEIQDGLQAGATWLGADMTITLFGKSDECYVVVNRSGGGPVEGSFRGRVVAD